MKLTKNKLTSEEWKMLRAEYEQFRDQEKVANDEYFSHWDGLGIGGFMLGAMGGAGAGGAGVGYGILQIINQFDVEELSDFASAVAGSSLLIGTIAGFVGGALSVGYLIMKLIEWFQQKHNKSLRTELENHLVAIHGEASNEVTSALEWFDQMTNVAHGHELYDATIIHHQSNCDICKNHE